MLTLLSSRSSEPTNSRKVTSSPVNLHHTRIILPNHMPGPSAVVQSQARLSTVVQSQARLSTVVQSQGWLSTAVQLQAERLHGS
jgi:hypothetical protein